MTQGELLKRARLHRGLSQQELADKIGVDRSTIAHYETDSPEPTRRALGWLSKALNVNLDNLCVK